MARFNYLQDARSWIKTKLVSRWRDTSHLKKNGRLAHVYEFTKFKDCKLTIGVLGCQGHNAVEKKQVALNIATRAPDLMIGLGDTFYDYGVTSEKDPLFESAFHQFYSTGELENTPFLSVLGNHDMNFQNKFKAAWGGMRSLCLGIDATPYDRMMGQIEHSYLEAGEKKNWYMMNDYYVVTTEYANIYFLNSNLLAFDIEQQEWLSQTYNALNDPKSRDKKWNIIAMHHPLYSPGKRYLGSDYDDIDQYALPEFTKELDDAKEKGARCLNFALYNYFVKLYSNGICFQLFLGAHDHLLAAMWQRSSLPESWQVISGAAGDPKELQSVKIPPQERCGGTFHFGGVDFYYAHNGHVELEIVNNGSIILKIYDIDNRRICQKNFQFSNASFSPRSTDVYIDPIKNAATSRI
ncbi:MAG: hypothetical protein EXR81_04005 [Gammaproteobacteria bacterium]|nr:hypothetical protein [Gammaproteobacteria bacterium]